MTGSKQIIYQMKEWLNLVVNVSERDEGARIDASKGFILAVTAMSIDIMVLRYFRKD